MPDARRQLFRAVLLLSVPAALASCSLGKGDGIVVRQADGGTAASDNGGEPDIVFVDDSGDLDMEPSSEWDGCDSCYGEEPEPPPEGVPGDDVAPDEGGDYVDDWDDYWDDWV
jgi:hypothetical protein